MDRKKRSRLIDVEFKLKCAGFRLHYDGHLVENIYDGRYLWGLRVWEFIDRNKGSSGAAVADCCKENQSYITVAEEIDELMRNEGYDDGYQEC